jgi:hypothetical protein
VLLRLLEVEEELHQLHRLHLRSRPAAAQQSANRPAEGDGAGLPARSVS